MQVLDSTSSPLCLILQHSLESHSLGWSKVSPSLPFSRKTTPLTLFWASRPLTSAPIHAYQDQISRTWFPSDQSSPSWSFASSPVSWRPTSRVSVQSSAAYSTPTEPMKEPNICTSKILTFFEPIFFQVDRAREEVSVLPAEPNSHKGAGQEETRKRICFLWSASIHGTREKYTKVLL